MLHKLALRTAALPDAPTRTLTVTITGKPENVDRVEALLSLLSLNSTYGHSGVFGISWDADGADFVQIVGIDTAPYKDLVDALGNHGAAVEYIGEGGTGCTYNSTGTKRVYPAE